MQFHLDCTVNRYGTGVVSTKYSCTLSLQSPGLVKMDIALLPPVPGRGVGTLTKVKSLSMTLPAVHAAAMGRALLSAAESGATKQTLEIEETGPAIEATGR
jgi:hypothetical protein